MITCRSQLTRQLDLPVSAAAVWSVVSTVPDSAAHFPHLRKLSSDKGGYTWELDQVGVRSYKIELSYASRYVADHHQRVLTWQPIAGVGNAKVSGRWSVQTHGEGSIATLNLTIEVSLAFPWVMKPAVEPFVGREMTRLVDGYIENLRQTLSGGDGRVSASAVVSAS